MNIPREDLDGSKVRVLPVKHKEPNTDRMLSPVDPLKCRHRGGFTVDVDGGKCTCNDCNEDVSPMFVLERLMNLESQWMRTRAAYADEMKRLSERARTKCEHCGQITRISHR